MTVFCPASADGPALGAAGPRPRRTALSVVAERREVAGGVSAYLGAGDGEDLGAVHRSHDLPAPGKNPGAQQEAGEIDALIAQGIALGDADDRWREPLKALDIR